jgi:hypothetical protein
MGSRGNWKVVPGTIEGVTIGGLVGASEGVGPGGADWRVRLSPDALPYFCSCLVRTEDIESFARRKEISARASAQR